MLSTLSSEKLEVLSKLLLYGLDLSCNLGTDLVFGSFWDMGGTWVQLIILSFIFDSKIWLIIWKTFLKFATSLVSFWYISLLIDLLPVQAGVYMH